MANANRIQELRKAAEAARLRGDCAAERAAERELEQRLKQSARRRSALRAFGRI